MILTLSQVSPNTKNKSLDLEWVGGRKSQISYLQLRKECPCAPCQDKRLASSKRPMALPSYNAIADEAIQLTGIEAIGNYAIGLKWADGHATGIYPFEFLMNLENIAIFD